MWQGTASESRAGRGGRAGDRVLSGGAGGRKRRRRARRRGRGLPSSSKGKGPGLRCLPLAACCWRAGEPQGGPGRCREVRGRGREGSGGPGGGGGEEETAVCTERVKICLGSMDAPECFMRRLTSGSELT